MTRVEHVYRVSLCARTSPPTPRHATSMEPQRAAGSQQKPRADGKAQQQRTSKDGRMAGRRHPGGGRSSSELAAAENHGEPTNQGEPSGARQFALRQFHFKVNARGGGCSMTPNSCSWRSVQCALLNALCSMRSVQCALFNALCSLRSAHCALFDA